MIHLLFLVSGVSRRWSCGKLHGEEERKQGRDEGNSDEDEAKHIFLQMPGLFQDDDFCFDLFIKKNFLRFWLHA